MPLWAEVAFFVNIAFAMGFMIADNLYAVLIFCTMALGCSFRGLAEVIKEGRK